MALASLHGSVRGTAVVIRCFFEFGGHFHAPTVAEGAGRGAEREVTELTWKMRIKGALCTSGTADQGSELVGDVTPCGDERAGDRLAQAASTAGGRGSRAVQQPGESRAQRS